ncbi:MAG: PEP-CTERM sorting domain-containing protein [Armatimonadota bacterium]
MKLNRLTIASLAVIVTASANAVILTPDVFTALPGTLTPGGTVVEDVLQSFSFAANGGTMSGTVQNRVVRKADNTYFFAWRIFNDANSSGPVQDLRLAGFNTSVYDGDWDPSSPGTISPTQAILFSFPGGFVNFNFNEATNPGGVTAGNSSKMFYLDTNATAYGQVAAYDLTNIGQSSASGIYSTFAPVPEPASLAILGIGVLALVRRKKKN